jgi:hypothetical protein
MLQTLLMMIMFAANLVQAAWTGHEEKRELSLGAEGLDTLQVEAGAGSLNVTGVAGNTIDVGALIHIPGVDEDEVEQIIADHLVLSLRRNGNTADLKGYFENIRRFSDSPAVDLEVRLPEGMFLNVEDSSGSVEVRNVRGGIELVDGSGSIRMVDVGGRLKIRDGSGSIAVEGAAGDIEIVDGSGSVTVVRVGGSVSVEDGSGSIQVSDVSGDLLVPDDGSGSLDYSSIAGRVEVAR